MCRGKAEWTKTLQNALSPTRPVNASPPEIPLAIIPGTYRDKAYGEIVICALPTSVNFTGGPPAESAVCRDTIAHNPFPTADPTIPTFIARFDKVASNYLLFTHHNGSVFIVTPSTFYPERNETTISQFNSYDAVFTEDGMAFMGNAWGAGPGVEGKDPMVIGVEGAAEVWFARSGIPE